MGKVKAVRCSAVAKDGTQCGQTTKSGRIPPLCGVHYRMSLNQPAIPNAVQFVASTPFDATEELIKIARNRSHPAQIQALKALRDDQQACRLREKHMLSEPQLRFLAMEPCGCKKPARPILKPAPASSEAGQAPSPAPPATQAENDRKRASFYEKYAKRLTRAIKRASWSY